MKKLLATLLAVVMLVGSFSMVSFAAESVPAEKMEPQVNIGAIIDIVEEKTGIETDADADGDIDVDDLLIIIESKVSAEAGDDAETQMIVTIVFTVIKIVFALVGNFVA